MDQLSNQYEATSPSLSTTHSFSVEMACGEAGSHCSPHAWTLWQAGDELRSWREREDDATRPLSETAQVVSRLAQRLQQGAAVVEQQEVENRRLEAACVAAQRAADEHHAQRLRHDSAVGARLTAAEFQLAETHASLQDAQRAHREAAAEAAATRDQLLQVEQEHSALSWQLELAMARVKEAQAHAEAACEERDAARREAYAARSDVDTATNRLRQAEELEAVTRRREVEVGRRQKEIEAEAGELREQRRQLEVNLEEYEATKKRLESRGRELSDLERRLQGMQMEIEGREASAKALADRSSRQRAEHDAMAAALQRREKALQERSVLLQKEEEAAKLAKESTAELMTRQAAERKSQLAALEKERVLVLSLRKQAEQAQEEARMAQAAASKSTAAAEARAAACLERVASEERKLKHLRDQCAAEETKICNLKAESAHQAELAAAQMAALQSAAEAAMSQEAALAARQKALIAEREALEAERTALQHTKDAIEERTKAMAHQETQLNAAAEAARKEQIVLSCARRDAATAASQMHLCHLRAAGQLAAAAVEVGNLQHGAIAAVETSNTTEVDDIMREIMTPVTVAAAVTPSLSGPLQSSEEAVRPAAPLSRVLSAVESSMNKWREQLSPIPGSPPHKAGAANTTKSNQILTHPNTTQTPTETADFAKDIHSSPSRSSTVSFSFPSPKHEKWQDWQHAEARHLGPQEEDFTIKSSW